MCISLLVLLLLFRYSYYMRRGHLIILPMIDLSRHCHIVCCPQSFSSEQNILNQYCILIKLFYLSRFKIRLIYYPMFIVHLQEIYTYCLAEIHNLMGSSADPSGTPTSIKSISQSREAVPQREHTIFQIPGCCYKWCLNAGMLIRCEFAR